MSDQSRGSSDLNKDRSRFLRGGMAAAGGLAAATVDAWSASASGPDPLITEVQEWNQVLGDGVDAAPYGVPSEFEAHVVRRDVP